MKVLIVGLGSIGKRHVRVLKSIIPADILALRSRNGNSDDEFIKQYSIRNTYSMSEAFAEKPDFAIISNPTSLHVEIAYEIAKLKIPFFIEKPVSHNMRKLSLLLKVVRTNNIPVLVGFQLRHHPGYKKMIEWMDQIGIPLHCHGYVGQYLPDWRNGVDYRKNYSAIASMGGGVILDLCHQIDISLSIMGKAKLCTSFSGKCSDLEIDTEDFGDILLSHENSRTSYIHMNYLEMNYVWYTRITGSKGSIIWDYGKGTVSLLQKGTKPMEWTTPGDFDRDSLFRDQMKHWLSVLKGEEKPVTGIEDGIEVTKIAFMAKKSMVKKRHIRL